MSHIKKTFESFVNEELNPSTYLSAADKLKKKGHSNRAKELTDHVDNLTMQIEPVEIDINGEQYTIGPENIYVNSDGVEGDGAVDFYVYLDKDIANALKGREEGDWSADFRYLWDSKFSPEQKEKFIEEYNMPKSMFRKSYDDLSDDEQNGFTEYAEMNDHLEMMHFQSYDPDGDLDRDGLIIPDRRNANKVLRLLKQFGETKGGKLNDLIQKLSVNDLYSN